MKSDIFEAQSLLGQGNIIVDKIVWEKNSVTISIRDIINHSEIFELQFLDTVNVEIRTGQYDTFSLIGLQIEDISSYQMEGKKIRVASEDDQGYLFFYCNSLKVITHQNNV